MSTSSSVPTTTGVPSVIYQYKKVSPVYSKKINLIMLSIFLGFQDSHNQLSLTFTTISPSEGYKEKDLNHMFYMPTFPSF